MLARDEIAKARPVRKDAGKGWFPPFEPLIDRIGEQGRHDRFDLIKLSRWSAGRVAISGDAAHALPPNIGQGGGCAMMNALSLAVHLERNVEVPAALAAWEMNERPITEHAQRMSYLLGLPATWPPFLQAMTLGWAGRSKWVVRQRTKTALHRPTGTQATLLAHKGLGAARGMRYHLEYRAISDEPHNTRPRLARSLQTMS